MPQRPRWLRWFLLPCFLAFAWGQGGPPGGAVSELLGFADDPTLFYAATNNGVLRSDDAGLSWRETGERLRGLSVSSVAGDRTVLYASTLAEGMFRSRDEGATWEQINQGIDVTAIASLATDPTNVNIVYAGSQDGGIFKTTNGGDNWAPARAGLPEGIYLDIAVDPANPQTVFAANASSIFANRGALAISSDGGQSWTAPDSGPVFCVTLGPIDSSVIYVGTSTGVFKSIGGQPLALILLTSTVVDIVVNPLNPDVVYAATRFARVAKSTDAGQNWVGSSQGMPRTELLSLALSSHDPSTVFAGSNGGGLFRSADAGANWDLSSRGLHFADIGALAVDPAEGAVLTAVPNGGAYRSVNGGASWGPARQGLETYAVRSLAFDPANPGVVYAGSVSPLAPDDGALFKSTDGGLQWEVLQTLAPFYALAAHPSDGRTLFIGSSTGVFRSSDGGQSFQGINGSDGAVAQRVVDLKLQPGSPNTIFAIVFDDLFTGNYQIFRTTNSGNNWTGAGTTAIPLLDLEIDPNDPARIYVAAGNGVFRSIDGGDEYRLANSGFPEEGVLVSSVAIDANANSMLYASTTSGVFRSADGADSWQPANGGLEAQGVLELVPDPRQAGVLYAATVGGGVFKTVDGGESWQPTGGVPLLTGAGVVNAADFGGGGVAPGEILSIFGLELGPPEGVQPGIDPGTGRLATAAAGVRVFFNDVEAPLFFVRADQLNVQVPFEVAGLERVTIRVEFEGAVSARVSVPVLPAHPGLFSAVLNQDSSLNSEDNRESSGRLVQLFATGQGLVEPAIATGALAPGVEPLPRATEQVRVTIGGRPAVVHFAGLAPGFVGLLQINAQIENGVPAGPAQVTLEIGGHVTATAGTVWVR